MEDKRHPGNDDVYGQRLDPGGQRLGLPFPISTHRGHRPRAAWSGSSWMVVWTDARTGSSDIRGITVTATGASCLRPFVVEQARPNSASSSIGFDGTNFVVAWADRRTGAGPSGPPAVTDRTVLDPGGLVVAVGSEGRPREPVDVGLVATVIAWPEPAPGAPRRRARVLRTAGFAGPAVVRAMAGRSRPRTAASAGALFATFRGEPSTRGTRPAQLDPQTGDRARAPSSPSPVPGTRRAGFDGNWLVPSTGGTTTGGRWSGPSGPRRLTGPPGRAPGGQAMLPASLAVLPERRAALAGMDPGSGRLWVVPIS